MPVAAVPSYLGRNFKDASPGMRFSLYLPIWTDRKDQESEIKQRAAKRSKEAGQLRQYLEHQGMEATIDKWTERERNPLPNLWAKNDHASRQVWREVARLTEKDLKLMRSLLDRQDVLAGQDGTGHRLTKFQAQSVAPFTTGLGNEHPLENGFSFLNPYGLPYLPGSGVKGVLRQAARELSSGDWGETSGWSEEKCYPLQVVENRLSVSIIDVLFGRESAEGETEHVRGVLCFWDVIPQLKGDSLMADIMTPHQGHYYQWKKNQRGEETGESPHESGQPNPITFLTVPPGSSFTFYVTCDVGRLEKIAPDLVRDNQWEELLHPLFEHAFTWLGFGAKTAVGYGAMQRDLRAENEHRAHQREMEEKKAREREVKKATARLPEDAAWLVEKTLAGAWPDNGAFLDDVEAYLAERKTLSSQGYDKFAEEMERRYPGIMVDPDAVRGKKQKPKFKDRPRKVAKRLMELKAANTPD